MQLKKNVPRYYLLFTIITKLFIKYCNTFYNSVVYDKIFFNGVVFLSWKKNVLNGLVTYYFKTPLNYSKKNVCINQFLLRTQNYFNAKSSKLSFKRRTRRRLKKRIHWIFNTNSNPVLNKGSTLTLF